MNPNWESTERPESVKGGRATETLEHYTFTFENPLVEHGTGIVNLLLSPSDCRKHAQVLANIFGTKVVTDRKGFKFDTDPEPHTNPYYAAQQGETMITVNDIRQARKVAQELANENIAPAYIEHLRCGKWVVIETIWPEDGDIDGEYNGEIY